MSGSRPVIGKTLGNLLAQPEIIYHSYYYLSVICNFGPFHDEQQIRKSIEKKYYAALQEQIDSLLEKTRLSDGSRLSLNAKRRLADHCIRNVLDIVNNDSDARSEILKCVVTKLCSDSWNIYNISSETLNCIIQGLGEEALAYAGLQTAEVLKGGMVFAFELFIRGGYKSLKHRTTHKMMDILISCENWNIVTNVIRYLRPFIPYFFSHSSKKGWSPHPRLLKAFICLSRKFSSEFNKIIQDVFPQRTIEVPLWTNAHIPLSFHRYFELLAIMYDAARPVSFCVMFNNTYIYRAKGLRLYQHESLISSLTCTAHDGRAFNETVKCPECVQCRLQAECHSDCTFCHVISRPDYLSKLPFAESYLADPDEWFALMTNPSIEWMMESSFVYDNPIKFSNAQLLYPHEVCDPSFLCVINPPVILPRLETLTINNAQAIEDRKEDDDTESYDDNNYGTEGSKEDGDAKNNDENIYNSGEDDETECNDDETESDDDDAESSSNERQSKKRERDIHKMITLTKCTRREARKLLQDGKRDLVVAMFTVGEDEFDEWLLPIRKTRKGTLPPDIFGNWHRSMWY